MEPVSIRLAVEAANIEAHQEAVQDPASIGA